MIRTFTSLLLFAVCSFLLLFAATADAQTTLTFEKINLMANGHIMTIQPPTLSGNDTFSFPSAPTGITPGYVEQGDITKPFLQWDATDNYWKAVTSSFGTGVTNRLTRWGSASTLDTSVIYDNGSQVGINTTSPVGGAMFQINNGNVVFAGSSGQMLDKPDTGMRMMWVSSIGAFRAGAVESTEWDSSNIGYNSFAVGRNSKALGTYAIAMGDSVSSPNLHSVCIGHALTASGYGSMALGNYASTNLKSGSFVYGDFSTNTKVMPSVANQFMVRATGGYVFYSSLNGAPTAQGSWIGAELLPGATSWSVISDSNRKENRLHANGEEVLGKIRNMWLGSWNYKGQDPKEFRHYGPMAQEFYAAFGNDGVGRSGNDTTITSGDFDGINMIAIQALEKRTQELKEKVDRITQLEEQNKALATRLLELEKVVKVLSTETRKENVVRTVSN